MIAFHDAFTKLLAVVQMEALHKTGPLADFLSDEELAAIRGPAETARGLPGRAYGAKFYELEQRRLFPRRWCPVAFASEVAEPGDVLPVELADWPLLLVRGRVGRTMLITLVTFHVVTFACLTIAFWPHLMTLLAFLPLERINSAGSGTRGLPYRRGRPRGDPALAHRGCSA